MAKKSAPPIRASSRRHLQSHGGSWKVAYADFVTAMMAFFLLMWIMNIVPKDVQKALETYFKDNSGPGKPQPVPSSEGGPEANPSPITEEQAARYAIAMRFKKIVTEDPFLKQSSGVSSDDTGVLLRINNDVMFRKGSAELSPEAGKVVKEVQEALKTFKLSLMVRGHTSDDEFRGGPFPSDWELSGARAGAVVRAILEDKGIAPNRVRAVSYGDTLPLVPTLNPDSPALNRRVEFYFHRADVMNSRVVN